MNSTIFFLVLIVGVILGSVLSFYRKNKSISKQTKKSEENK